jgi:hypothetical protein
MGSQMPELMRIAPAVLLIASILVGLVWALRADRMR